MSFDSNTRPVCKTALLGKSGEKAVGDYLTKQGFTLLCYNFSSRWGEIDIIVQNKNLICFVEVKTRTTAYCSSSELIPPSKQKKIIATAQFFCLKNHIKDNHILRFDVALTTPLHNEFSITYIANAFCSQGNL